MQQMFSDYIEQASIVITLLIPCIAARGFPLVHADIWSLAFPVHSPIMYSANQEGCTFER